MTFKDKIVLITGASRGIGRATAVALASKGCHVVINYSKDKEVAEKVVEEIKKVGSRSIAVKADVSIFKEVEKMVKTTIEVFAGIDFLINNAGIPQIHHYILDLTGEEWDRVLAVNLKGMFNCSKAVLRFMKTQKRGKIVNIASIAGRVDTITGVAYTASKAGVIGFTLALAAELSPYGITVNAVAPGAVDTAWHSEEKKWRLANSAPLKRIAKPEEVADAIIFLLSNNYITGEIISIDGGVIYKKL